MRLQKALAAAGLGSRRKCEEMILAGRVEVDRRVVLELGTRVALGQDIRVDGVPIKSQRQVYFLVNKPVGVLATNRDPSGRPRVIDLLPLHDQRVYTVGRLDLSSEGLILVTNDGDLANLLTHPRFGVEKTYQVLVAGGVDPAELEKLKQGIFLSEGFARVVRLTVKSQRKGSTLLEIVLDEGRNREIRRLLARVGHKVLKLKRIAIAGIKLGDLAPGEVRRLRTDELRDLRQAVRLKHKRPSPAAIKSAKPPAAIEGEAVVAAPQQPPFKIEDQRRKKKRRPQPLGERGRTAHGRSSRGEGRGKRGPQK